MSPGPARRPLMVGILSDTHLSRPTPEFAARVARCFAGVDLILHAGDLTEVAILSVFGERPVHAVHGNMCSLASRQILPRKLVVEVGGFRLGLIHNAGNGYDFEDQLLDEFEGIDAIVYGHTHRPLCESRGGVLLINPGAFLATGRYGHPGTFALLEVGEGLKATIHEVPAP